MDQKVSKNILLYCMGTYLFTTMRLNYLEESLQLNALSEPYLSKKRMSDFNLVKRMQNRYDFSC